MSVLSKMDVETYIVGLYQQMLESGALDWDKPNLALRFNIKIAVSHNGYLKDGNTYVEAYDKREVIYFSIIVTARHRVYVASSTENCRFEFEPKDFVNTSNHDSCWKSDGLSELTRGYFYMCGEVVKNWPEGTAPAPIELNTRIQVGDWLGHNPIQFVTVTFGPKRKDNDYFNSLEKIDKLNFKITLDTPEPASTDNLTDVPEEMVSTIYLHEDKFGSIPHGQNNLKFTEFANETSETTPPLGNLKLPEPDYKVMFNGEWRNLYYEETLQELVKSFLEKSPFYKKEHAGILLWVGDVNFQQLASAETIKNEAWVGCTVEAWTALARQTVVAELKRDK